MASATIRDSVATNPGGTGSTLTATLPTHAAGDIIKIAVGNTGNVLWTGNPAGWARADQKSVGTASNGLVQTIFQRRVLAGDSLPLADPVFTLGATVSRMAFAWSEDGASEEGVFTLSAWAARAFNTGTTNPIRPTTVTTPAPEGLITTFYFQRAATNAPDPSGYIQDEELIISGTLVGNLSHKTVADQNTSLSNQDASPTSGARWTAGICFTPSADYPYFRSGSQATTGSGTTVTPVQPAGTTDSDVLGNKDIMIATVEGSGSTTISAQDGSLWTAISEWSTNTSGGGSSVKKFWCYATASPNMQFNRTGTGEISACITTHYNCHQTNAIRNTGVRQNASSTTSTWNALTRGSSRLLVQASCIADGVPTFTPPSGWSERMDGLGIICADQTYNATGDSASASFTLSSGSPTLVGLLEIAGTASVAEFARSATVDGAALIATSPSFFSIANGAATIGATGNVSSAGVRQVSRAAAFDCAVDISSSGTIASPPLERTASINVNSNIESAAVSFSVLERNAEVNVSGGLESAGQFLSILNSSADLDAASVVSISATFFTVTERSSQVDSTASIDTSALFFSTFSRTLTVDVGGSVEVTAEFFSTLGRTSLIQSVGAIDTSALFFSDLSRSVSIETTAAINASATFFSFIERESLIDGQVLISVAGESESGVATFERSAIFDSLTTITVSAGFFSVFDKEAGCDAFGEISSTGQRNLLRSVSLNALGFVNAQGQMSGSHFHPKNTAHVRAVSRALIVQAEDRSL